LEDLIIIVKSSVVIILLKGVNHNLTVMDNLIFYIEETFLDITSFWGSFKKRTYNGRKEKLTEWFLN